MAWSDSAVPETRLWLEKILDDSDSTQTRHGIIVIVNRNQLQLVINYNEDSFSAEKKVGAVFVDLTAAYNTVWHRGLTCKAAAIAAW